MAILLTGTHANISSVGPYWSGGVCCIRLPRLPAFFFAFFFKFLRKSPKLNRNKGAENKIEWRRPKGEAEWGGGGYCKKDFCLWLGPHWRCRSLGVSVQQEERVGGAFNYTCGSAGWLESCCNNVSISAQNWDGFRDSDPRGPSGF